MCEYTHISYICIFIYICTNICLRKYTQLPQILNRAPNICICLCIYTPIYIYIYLHTYICKHTLLWKCMPLTHVLNNAVYIYTYIYIYVYINTYVYIYILMYIHTHTSYIYVCIYIYI